MTGTRTAEAAPAEVGEQQPRLVDGLKVIKDEPELSPLSKPGKPAITFRGRRVLTLEDNSQVHGCADCLFVGTRGEVIKHRVEDHDAAKGGARAKDTGAPTDNVMRMTLGEVLRLAGQIDGWEELVTALEQRATTAEAERDTARTELRRIKRALEKAGFAPKVDEED